VQKNSVHEHILWNRVCLSVEHSNLNMLTVTHPDENLPRLWRFQKFYHVKKKKIPPLDPILSDKSTVHIITTNFCKGLLLILFSGVGIVLPSLPLLSCGLPKFCSHILFLPCGVPVLPFSASCLSLSWLLLHGYRYNCLSQACGETCILSFHYNSLPHGAQIGIYHLVKYL